MPATYEPIATTTLGGAAATITFSSIPATYTDLRLVVVGQAATGFAMYVSVNNDTTSVYSYTKITGNGSSASSARASNRSQFRLGIDNGMPTSNWALAQIDLFSYTGSTNKTILTNWSADLNGSGESEQTVQLWRSTAVINRIDISCAAGSANLNTGTTATLYGIKNA
jgi:hypothetical protein